MITVSSLSQDLFSLILSVQEDEKPSRPSKSAPPKQSATSDPPEDDVDPEDPLLTVPLPRYNAMLAVLRNTLYMCAGSILLASNFN